MNEANVCHMAEKASHLLLLDLFSYYSVFILSLTIQKNRKILKHPLNFFLTCRSLHTYQQATGSCLSLYTKEYWHDWHSNSVSGIWLNRLHCKQIA